MKSKCILMLLVLVIGCSPIHVSANSAGIYTVQATPTYRHPVTGDIEDSGNNEGIGQSMTESVIYNTALMEIDTNGKIYATARYYLTDQISDVKVWTQKRGASGWTSASTTITQENIGGKPCSDYRFAVPSKDAIVKTSCYVGAMGRTVIFYYSFSNLKSGSADFVTTIKVDTNSSSTTTSSSSDSKSETTTSSDKTASSDNKTEDSVESSKTEAFKDSEIDESAISDSVESEVTESANQDDSFLSAEEKIAQADGLIISLDSEVDSESAETTGEATTVTVTEEKSSFAEVFQIVAAAILAGVLTGVILIALIGVGAYYIIKTIKEREN